MVANKDNIDWQVTESVAHPFLRVTRTIQLPRRVAKKGKKYSGTSVSLLCNPNSSSTILYPLLKTSTLYVSKGLDASSLGLTYKAS
jgi:hypothetical protein